VSEYITLIVTCLAMFMLGYWVGWMHGKQYGADSQWVDDFLDRARREQARRDALGRFKEAKK
jgi:hypothetical protein